MYRLPVHRNWEPITARFPQSSCCPLPRKLIVTATYPQYASTYTPAGGSLSFEIKIEDSDNFGGDPRQVHATEDLPKTFQILNGSLRYLPLRHIPFRFTTVPPNVQQ